MHSAVANWKKCLHSIKLKDSVLSLVYVIPSQGLGIGRGLGWPGLSLAHHLSVLGM